MYKIYNNEIKITQNLKGGSGTFIKELEDPAVELSNNGLKGNTGVLKKPLKHLVPLNGKSIDYKKFDEDMFKAILGDIDKLSKIFFEGSDNDLGTNYQIFNTADGGIFNFDNNKAIEINNLLLDADFADLKQLATKIDPVAARITAGTSEGLGATKAVERHAREEGGLLKYQFGLINKDRISSDNDDKNIFNKNILRYAMSFAKEIELYDVLKKKLLTYDEFIGLFNPSPKEDEPINFIEMITKTKKTDPKKYERMDKFKAVILGIGALLEKYEDVASECSKMYPKILKEHKLPHWTAFYTLSGGYDSLKYSLDGGVLSTLIRVPDLAKHFKAQLSVLESKLKMSNKTLSSVSKNKINTVIDQLEKHEKFLKDTFELLRNSPFIDENKVDFDAHKDKLKEAKISLRKHDRYRSYLTDIIKTIIDANKSVSNTPYFS